MASRDFLVGIPHVPDQRSWDAFPMNWPSPEGAEYLGRILEEVFGCHS